MGEFVMELWAFMKERKKLGTLIVLTQGLAVAPFVYTLFRNLGFTRDCDGAYVEVGIIW